MINILVILLKSDFFKQLYDLQNFKLYLLIPNTKTHKQRDIFSRDKESIQNMMNNKERKHEELWLCRTSWQFTLKSSDCTKISKLGLQNCNINDSNVSIIANLQWPHLSELYLSSNYLTWKGVNLLLCNTWTNLKLIRLQKTKIGSEGAKILAKINMPLVSVLQLSSCHIGNDGAKHLPKGTWTNLKQLHLQQNFIQADGYSAIVENNWRKMKKLKTSNNNDLQFSNLVHPVHALLLIVNESRRTSFSLNSIKSSEMKNRIRKIHKQRSNL